MKNVTDYITLYFIKNSVKNSVIFRCAVFGAIIIGINSYYLGEIERGEKHASLDVLFKFADHFNLKIHELINVE